MTTRNRELSQFGSFIYVENSTQEIGITTEALPFVGIGTTNPQSKLDVVGDTNISGTANIGIVSATEYYLNGNLLIDPEISPWTASGSDIYRQSGNVGIGTSVFTEKLTVNGNISAGRFISTVSTGTSPFEVSSLTLVTHLNADYLRGKIAPAGDIVGTSDSQTLTNKTINLTSNTLTGTTAQFNAALSDNNFATTVGIETLTNKTLTSPTISSIENSGTKTIPTGIGTFVITGSTGTISSGMIADGTIVNADIAVGAAITYGKLSLSNSIVNSDIAVGAAITNGKLANSTISGISLGSNLNDLTAGSFITYNSGTTYNGSIARTISVNATSSNTPSTIISRDSSGGFNAASLSVHSSGIIVSGITTLGLGVTSSPSNSQLSFDLPTDTTLRIKVKGTDGILRNVNIELSSSGEVVSSDELGLFW